jgi:hypothetical protein
MQSLNIFINEMLSNKQKELIGKLFSTMFKDTKINKEQIGIILTNLDKEELLEISKYFSNNESSDYLAYEPNEDMFINFEDNKEKIISQISEYISKFKV